MKFASDSNNEESTFAEPLAKKPETAPALSNSLVFVASNSLPATPTNISAGQSLMLASKIRISTLNENSPWTGSSVLETATCIHPRGSSEAMSCEL